MRILQFLIFGTVIIFMWAVFLAIMISDVKSTLIVISSLSLVVTLLLLLVYKIRKIQVERRVQDIWAVISKRNLLNSKDFKNWYNSSHEVYGLKIYEIMNNEIAFQKLKKDILTLDKIVLYDTVFK